MSTTTVRFNLEDVIAARSDYIGFCTSCGAAREMCEPDARRYTCEECGDHAVYGAEEIILMGLIDAGEGEAADV